MKGKSIGEALAAIGVIVSLVFVATEIRQNTVALRTAAYQAIGLAAAASLDDLAHDRELFENVFAKAPPYQRWTRYGSDAPDPFNSIAVATSPRG